jgi:serine/threonine protein kinase
MRLFRSRRRKTMDHPTTEKLAAFLRGQLSLAEQSAIEDHIAACAACCTSLRAIPDDAFVGRLRGATPPPIADKAAAAVAPVRERSLPPELRNHPRYKLGRFLGAGGMGVVYQAEHRLMERPVALKIMHRDLMQRSRIVDRFRQEVKAAGRLHHANIVTAFDADQAGDVHFLVMEFVDGVSLNVLVARRGPLGVAHACNYTAQAAQGLQHAFEKGMVHRDIKPHNLMLTRDGKVKILDFGLARLASEVGAEPLTPEEKRQARPGLTLTGDVMGTPEYMAPEQAFDPHRADIRATLYYFLVGQPPYAEGSVLTKLISQARPVTDFRDDIPEELAAIIERMMTKDLSERYQTPTEVVKALARFGKASSGMRKVGAKPAVETEPPKVVSVPPVEPGPPKPAVVSTPELLMPAATAPPPAKASMVPMPSKPAVRAVPPAPAKPVVPAPPPLVKPPAPTSATSADLDRTPTPAKDIPPLFIAQCPFCPSRIRVTQRSKGASVLCPQCGSYFTAVPPEDSSDPRRPWIK